MISLPGQFTKCGVCHGTESIGNDSHLFGQEILFFMDPEGLLSCS